MKLQLKISWLSFAKKKKNIAIDYASLHFLLRHWLSLLVPPFLGQPIDLCRRFVPNPMSIDHTFSWCNSSPNVLLNACFFLALQPSLRARIAEMKALASFFPDSEVSVSDATGSDTRANIASILKLRDYEQKAVKTRRKPFKVWHTYLVLAVSYRCSGSC